MLKKYDEMPDFPLYADQVISILEKDLSFLHEDKIITKTMINNYIKHGSIESPAKKKYNRDHIAYFTMITLLKSVFSFEQIDRFILSNRKENMRDLYNTFVTTYEEYYRIVFKGEIIRCEHTLLNSMISSCVYKLCADIQLHEK